MDIFGTIVNALHLTNRIINYVRAVQDADDDRSDLLLEASALNSLLLVLHDRVRDAQAHGSASPWNSAIIALGVKNGPLDQCKATLEFLASKLEPADGVKKLGQKLKWPFDREEIRERLPKLERLKTLISLALQSSLTRFAEDIQKDLEPIGVDVKELLAGIFRVEDNQKHLQAGFALLTSNADDEKRQKIAEWLSPVNFDEQQITAFSKCALGTGKWFLEHPRFTNWLNADGKVLWCPGIPGAGKTTLASVIINHIRLIPEDNVAILFFYFNYTIDYTIAQVLEAVLKQLARRRLAATNMESLGKCMANSNSPTLTVKELLHVLQSELDTYSRRFIVIDALDECPDTIRLHFLADMKELARLSNAKLLVTSREVHEIERDFEGDVYLNITARDEDMKLYINSRITGDAKLRRLVDNPTSLREEVLTEVIAKSNGMFLMVRLHMDSLSKKTNRKAIKSALNELPKELNHTYDEAMKRIDDDHKELAYQVFSWLTHARGPLSLSDLQYALAVREGMTELDTDDLDDELFITSICAGLVTVRQDTTWVRYHGYKVQQIVGLVHYTTREYFLHIRNTCHQFPDPVNIALTCLRYLSFDEFRGPWHRGSWTQMHLVPFFGYAIRFWGEHAQQHSDNITVNELVTKLLRNDTKVVLLGSEASIPSPSYVSRENGKMLGIHICAYFGLNQVVESLIADGVDINSKEPYGRTPLFLTVARGHEAVVKLSLATIGIDVNLADNDHFAPLSVAARDGNEAAVKLLLTRKDINVNPHGNWNTTPLIYAATQGHKTIVQLLLAADGVNVNHFDQNRYGVLQRAAEKGHDAVVKLLLARDDVAVNASNYNRTSSLFVAVEKGHKAVMQLLLERNDVDVNLESLSGALDGSPLTLAARKGDKEVVRMLLGKVDILVNFLGWETPLTTAVGGRHEGVVKMLLARDDIDVNLKNKSRMAPLCIAVKTGAEAITKLLLSKDDINVNVKGEFGRRPLHFSTRSTTVKLLLARDVEVNAKDDEGATPLHRAARFQVDAEVLELLLATEGVDVNSLDNKGRTPLHYAIKSWRRSELAVRLLVGKDGIDSNAKDNKGRTALLTAAKLGREELVKLLLAREGIDPNLMDNWGMTPLSWATARGHEAVLKLLLARDGIDKVLKEAPTKNRRNHGRASPLPSRKFSKPGRSRPSFCNLDRRHASHMTVDYRRY